MKLAIFAYSRQGCHTARKVKEFFPDEEIRTYTMERFREADFEVFPAVTGPFYGENFAWADALIFVGSCGIAVRVIAPHIKDKRTDPAVICIDDAGNFVIPLLSGHIGGANALATDIAGQLGATPVITTATDIHKKFAVDSWSTKNNYVIDSMESAKAVSAAILEQDIPLCSDLPIISDYPSGIIPGESGEIGIYISWLNRDPFARTLRLIPKVLHLGIGCRKGVTAAVIAEAVKTVLAQNNIDIRAIKSAASIDLKEDDPGLLEFCSTYGWLPVFYSAAELEKVIGDFSSSEFVKSVTGVDNVCERAALINAERLIVRKTALNGVTVAIAAEKAEVHFG